MRLINFIFKKVAFLLITILALAIFPIAIIIYFGLMFFEWLWKIKQERDYEKAINTK